MQAAPAVPAYPDPAGGGDRTALIVGLVAGAVGVLSLVTAVILRRRAGA